MEKHKLIFVNRQALGDVVVLTALVRDLHKCYPGKFATRVSTSYPTSVWMFNPYICSPKECPAPPASRVIKMHYGDQMRMAANGVRLHFMEGFMHYFNNTVGGHYGVEVKLTNPKPDLHLSPGERKTKPKIAGTGPYWIMVAGGKSDMTTKWWDKNSYQAVANNLTKAGIKVVQCGGRNHYHPRLDNVTSMVGKTKTREFIHMIAHAAGVICPITCAMHIAAAFDKPAVVIAGSREAVHWEKYPGHTFLHTIGKIHCGVKVCHACTTSQISRVKCKDFIRPREEGNAIPVARCMHAITPEMVTDAVLAYDINYDAKTYHWPIEVDTVLPVDISFIKKRLDGGNRRPIKKQESKVSSKPTRTKPDTSPENIIMPKHPLTVADIVLSARKERTSHPPRGLGEKLTVSTVFYGGGTDPHYKHKSTGLEHHRFQDLHLRFLNQFASTVPWDRIGSFRVALNDISDIVIEALDALKEFCPVIVYGPNVNRYKYPRLREMWYDPDHPLDTEAVLIFDDDIKFENPEWFSVLEKGVTIGRKKGAVVFGDHYTFRPTRRTMKWYMSRYWWHKKDPQVKGGRKRVIVNFTLGGAWVMLSDYIKALNWPDSKLGHNGGDVALGMALWQSDMKFHPVKFCNQQNTPRRGVNEGHPFL